MELTLKIKIGKKEITLTEDEARELREKLNNFANSKIHWYPYEPIRTSPWWVYDGDVPKVTITSTGSSASYK